MIAGGRIVDIRLAQFQRKFVGDCALKIIDALLAAIADLPGLLVVVASDGGIRPVVAVAGDFPAVVEIIKHSELQRQFVLVGSDVRTVHGERRIAVPTFRLYFQVAQNLIVGAIFFENVNHVANRIGAAMKLDLDGIGEEEIAFLDLAGEISRSFSAAAKV